MNSSNSNSLSPVKERRRTPMACTNCRSRKLKCRPVGSVDSAPCERCVKDGVYCEYRPVDTSLGPNNQTFNYDDDNSPIILYPVNSAPLPTQESNSQYVPIQGGYVSDTTQTPFHTHPHYTTPPYQHSSSSSYPSPVQYTNSFPLGYPADQSNFQLPSQFVGQSQYASMQYAHGHGNGSSDHRGYLFNGYDQNMHSSNYGRE